MADANLTSYHRDRYGRWGGNPDGDAADPAYCAETVIPEVTRTPKQCSRRRGFGPEGAFCKQHAKMYGPGYA